MSAHAAPTDRTKRFRAQMWLSAVLAGLGALLLVLSSCSSTTPPPAPNSANAGSIDGEASTVASTPPSSESAPAASSTSTSAPSTRSSSSATKPPSTSSSARSTSSSVAQPSTPASTTALNTSVTPIVPIVGLVLEKSKPLTLTIPAIGVTDSPVLDMSLNADGSIEVPPLDDTKSSGWYDESPTPGELGPSVLLGHVDSRANGPSVFYKLGDLQPGDEIEVGRADGSVAVFKVDGVREYAKDNFPTQTIYGNLDHAGLRLITCGGTFNPSVGHYESNVIAFATLMSSRQA